MTLLPARMQFHNDISALGNKVEKPPALKPCPLREFERGDHSPPLAWSAFDASVSGGTTMALEFVMELPNLPDSVYAEMRKRLGEIFSANRRVDFINERGEEGWCGDFALEVA